MKAAVYHSYGDDVFGTTAPRFGAHAEYACLSELTAVAPKPTGVAYTEAAALADATALCFLRDKARVQRGQAVLINGLPARSAPPPSSWPGTSAPR